MIRLLTRSSSGDYEFREFHGDRIPAYAILSHTWEIDNSQEVRFDELHTEAAKTKAGYKKIVFCGVRAVEDGLQYFWVDSCCINKRSEIELSEAINSMFRWYHAAARCYVYLSDVPAKSNMRDLVGRGHGTLHENEIRASRWFTRGWTLQELIAPRDVRFYDRNGHPLGDRLSMENLIHVVTGIAKDILRGGRLSDHSVEERLTWMERRTTTREEDVAYSMLGIFNVTMPLIYGEKKEKALRRLRKEIDDIEFGPRAKRQKARMSEPDPGTDACFLAKAAVLNILKFEEIEDRRLNIKASYSKTCIWLLQDPAYLEWLNSDEYHKHRGFFWIKGKPGCGKSTLAKFAYTQLSLLSSAQTPSPSRQDTILSFFFNARGTELERSAAGLYRSLITQLLASCKNDKQLVSTLTCAAFSPTERLIANTDMLKQLLTILLCDVHRSSVVMMIDALDECSEDEIRDMIDFFEELGDRASLDGWEFRVWFSSRHYPHITAKTSVQLVLEDQPGHGHDVERYISGKLKIGQTKQAEAIQQQVHERASGVFLWVVLVVDILNKAFDRGQVRALQAKLQDIPDNLHDLFQDILMRDNLHMAEMRLCFAWLLHAKRPLKPEELFYAILSGSSSDALCPKWDPTEMSLKDITRFILSSSKGLAEITKSKTRNVQFIHESVRDFLLNGPRDHTPGADWSKTFSDTLGQSHNQLKQCCYTYIQGEIRSKASSDFGVEDGNEAQARNIVTDQYPFLDYAVHNVFTHADEAQYHGFDQQAFLAEFELTGWVQLNNTHEEFKVRRIPQDIDLCYLFAEQDLPNLFKAVIAVKPKLSGAAPVYGRYGLPAYAAIACNSHRVFDILLQDKLPAVTAQPLHRNTAESKTSDHKIFSFLMKKTTAIIQKFVLTCTREAVLMRGNNGETLLSWSIQGGHVHLVESLLGHGFDLNVNHGGALVTALDLNHKIIIDMLLERASQLSQATLHNCIDHCVRKGYRSALEKLLQQYTFSARIFVPTNEDTGPILEAAKVGDHLLVKFFLYNNFYFYCSLDGPFIAASERGHMKVVEAFSRHGGGIDALGYDEGGMTALCLAARQNDSETVRLLLSLGADVSRCGWAFLDALSTAAYYGSLDAVQILLVHCSNPNAPEQQRLKSSSIDEALRNASKCAEEHIVALLLQHGANPKATETSSVRNGYTALHFAVMSRERGHIWAGRTTHSQRRRIIQLLLDSGADINARNAYAETILAVAENAHANQEIIALLQSNGAIL